MITKKNTYATAHHSEFIPYDLIVPEDEYYGVHLSDGVIPVDEPDGLSSLPTEHRYFADLCQDYWDLQAKSGVPAIIGLNHFLIARSLHRQFTPWWHRVFRWVIFSAVLYYLVAGIYTALK